jgi:hypothetical protein
MSLVGFYVKRRHRTKDQDLASREAYIGTRNLYSDTRGQDEN